MVNRLVSLMCWNIITWNLTAQIIGIANFSHMPLSNYTKLINIVTRQTITLRQLMLLNAVTLTRYIFICWLKNPIAFYDEFWTKFINHWIIGFSLIVSFIGGLLQDLENTCLNKCIDRLEQNVSYNTLRLVLCSLSIHMILYMRIAVYNQKSKQFVHSLHATTKNLVMAEWDKYSLTNLSLNACFLVCFILAATVSLLARQYEPLILEICPSYNQLSTSLNLLLPSIMSLLFVFAFYVKNPAMRKSVIRVVKNKYF